MLLTLLTAASSVTFFASAVLAAKHEHATLGGYLMATLVGLALAGCNAWGIYKVGDVLAHQTGSSSKARQEWSGKAFFLVILLWLPFAAFVGNWAASAVMRFAT
jgi:hypothetical protein